MDAENLQTTPPAGSAPIHWGHFGLVLGTMVLLLGISWMKDPALFSFKKSGSSAIADPGVPKYYAYVAPAEDQQPQVLGASTEADSNVPGIIQDDGTVVPVNMSQVLGASTEGVQLSLDEIKVNSVVESPAAVAKYFSQAQSIEGAFTGDAGFGSALSSGNQAQINQYAQKLIGVRDSLQKIPVPTGLVKLQKLKIIQYNSSIGLLQNFTSGDQNADAVNQDLQQFLKSQQDLDTENVAVAQKYGSQDPNQDLYINPDGTVITAQASVMPSPVAAGAPTQDASSGFDLANP